MTARDGDTTGPRFPKSALAGLRSLPGASVIVFDHELRYVLAAGPAVGQAGLEAAALEGRPIADVLPAERWAFWEPLYRSALCGEESSVEVRSLDASCWYHVDVGPLRGGDADGAVVGGMAVVRDITQRQQAQDRVEGLLESAPDAMVVVDERGSIVLVNAQTEKLFGYGRSELLGERVERLVPERARRYHADHRSGYSAGPYTRRMGSGLVLRGRRRDGSEFPAEISLSPLETENGTLVSCVIRDVSDRERLEGAWAHLAAVVESSNDAIISKRLDGTIVSWNPGAERLYGYSEAEVTGKSIALLVPGGHDDEVPGLLARVAAGERVEQFETLRRRKDGSQVDVVLTISAVRAPSGRVVGASSIARDITEAKTAEAQRERLSEELRQKAGQLAVSSNYKSEFMANMSHELRTPLNSVMILAGLLRDNSEHTMSAKQVQWAGVILDSSQELLNLLNDLFDFARVESGTVPIVMADVSVSELCTSLLHEFEPVARSAGLRYSIELAPGSPENIVTDPQRLRQILKNLLANAFKFTEQGEVQVRVGLAQSGWNRDATSPAQATSAIAFAIRDTGIGIDQEQQRRIFEAFVQGDGSTSRVYGGTGLSLSISGGLAGLLGGEITVDSIQGKGSTFTVRLPLNGHTTPPPPVTATSVTPPTKSSGRPAAVSPAATAI